MSNNLRERIISLLNEKDYESLIKLWFNDNRVVRILISLTYNKEDVIAWRAIEAIGLITKAMAIKKPDDVRNLAGRLLWMIRDESGGIGWSSPEILGEIIRNNPELCVDLVPILLSFHEEEMLCAGVIWAMGRISETSKELVSFAIPTIVSYLNNPNPYIRGMAIWSLNRIDPDGYKGVVRGHIHDDSEIMIYDKGELQRKTITKLIE